MPYIRNISGHGTEDRRKKIDSSITAVVNTILDTVITGTIREGFFDCTYLLFDEWRKLASTKQGAVRYYNFNDYGGIEINAIREMKRRMKVEVNTFPPWHEFVQDNKELCVIREERLRTVLAPLVAKFDDNLREAVGECNYSISEIAVALVNQKQISEVEAIQCVFAGGERLYDTHTAPYEEASIMDPKKGDTKGYQEYVLKHPEKFIQTKSTIK